MDRFIGKENKGLQAIALYLKSNMDRFIGYSSDSVPKDFRI